MRVIIRLKDANLLKVCKECQKELSSNKDWKQNQGEGDREFVVIDDQVFVFALKEEERIKRARERNRKLVHSFFYSKAQ